MVSVRTRKCSQSPTDSKLSFSVGQGKEFLHSEVPTLRPVIQRGILIKEGLILEQGAAKKDIHVKQIVVGSSDFCTMANIRKYPMSKMKDHNTRNTRQ